MGQEVRQDVVLYIIVWTGSWNKALNCWKQSELHGSRQPQWTPPTPQLKAQCSLYLAEVSTQCCCRRKITTLWISSALPASLPFADLLSDTMLLIRSAGIRAHTGVMELLSSVSLHGRCFNSFKELLLWNSYSPPWLLFILAVLPLSFTRKHLIPWPLICNHKEDSREYRLQSTTFSVLSEITGRVDFNNVRKAGRSI